VITYGEDGVKVFNRRQPPPGSGLHECPLCHDDFVVPVEAEALDQGRWDLRLRCGQCGTYRDVVVSDDIANRYSLDLDRGMAQIAAELKRQDHERMTAEARVFIAALENDLIDGGDFASG
jgi:transcription elongation factor Elf1